MASKELEREIAVYESRTPRSKALQQEATHYLPGGSSRTTCYFEPYPFFVDRGEGHYIYDVDGNRYLDFMINAGSLIMGHASPLVVNALKEQAARGLAFSGPTEAQIELAKLLCDRVPSLDTVRFVNSGTEATLNVIRAARAYTGRHKIAKIEGGYHGAHEYASVTVYTAAEKLDPAGPSAIPEFPGMPPSVLEGVVVLPYNDLDRCERIIRANKDDLACVIMEAVVSNFGYATGKPDFLQGMRDLTRELGILLIFDEVQSLRIAPGGAQEYFDVTPDLTAMGKIVGGGTPAAAFGGRDDIMALFDPTDGGATIVHAGTLNANPMSMVAGAVTMRHLTPDVYERMNRLGGTLRDKLRAVFDELDIPVQVTGVGSFFGIHFTSEEITDYRSVLRGDRQKKRALFLGMLNESVLLNGSSGGALNTLTTEEEIDTMVDATRSVAQRIK